MATKARTLIATLLALSVLVPGTATAGSVASAGSPARVSVPIPATARASGVVMLELGITAAKRPAGHLGAAVRLRRPDGSAVELGRITVTPGGQSYQLNAGALRRMPGGAAEIEVELIDRGGSGPLASGARLTVSRARIVTR